MTTQILFGAALALTSTDATTTQTSTASMVSMLVLPIALLVLMYFILIRPQRKQEKKQKEERGKLAVGDTVVTIGGVVGKVVNIKDDDITIASSVANTLLTFRRDAINTVKKPVSDN